MPSQINNSSVLSSASKTYCLLLDTAEAVSTVISSQRSARAGRPTLNHNEKKYKERKEMNYRCVRVSFKRPGQYCACWNKLMGFLLDLTT